MGSVHGAGRFGLDGSGAAELAEDGPTLVGAWSAPRSLRLPGSQEVTPTPPRPALEPEPELAPALHPVEWGLTLLALGVSLWPSLTMAALSGMAAARWLG